MPFGLCNAPSTFQWLMQRLFGDQQCQSLLLYLDDIVVFSSTVEQHLVRLELLLERLQQQGLKAKLSKCAFFQREVLYLGHVVSDRGVSTDPSKVEVVTNCHLLPSQSYDPSSDSLAIIAASLRVLPNWRPPSTGWWQTSEARN